MSKKGNIAAKKKLTALGLSVNSISVVTFSIFCIVLTAGLYFGQQEPLRKLALQRQTVANSITKQTALRFTSQVESYSQLMSGLAKDPQLINLFSENNLQAWGQRETELKTVFPMALRVRLLASNTSQPDRRTEPHFTYACLDLLNQSRKSMDLTQVEMHELEGRQQHIDMMQAVVLRGKIVGFIQLAIDPGLLQQWTKNVADKSYLEIHQKLDDGKNHQIAKAGTEIKQGVHAVVAIPGTHWHVESWTPFEGVESAFNLTIVSILVIGIILSAVIVLVSRILLHKELINDLEKYLMLVTGTMRGLKQVKYDFNLTEFKIAASNVANIRTGQNNMERERDGEGEKNNPSTLSMSPGDPMFLDKNAIQLEEFDNLAALDNSEEQVRLETSPEKTSTVSTNLPSLPEEIFKAYDIRGIVGKTLTVENIQLIGHALGSEAKARGLDAIVFARDGRLSGPELGKSLVKGLMASGLKVIDIGMLPTPTLYYAAAELTSGTGVMLTGSHNPPEYNGIKMVLGGDTLSGEAIKMLRHRIISGNVTHGEGAYSNEKILDKYVNRITSDINLKRKIKIVIDCGNGVAGAVAPILFNQLGCDVIPLYCEVDGKFPNHHPDPSKLENLGDLIAAVRKQNADLGIAFDGDGDRLGVVSGDGKIIWPDRLMMLFSKDVLSRNPGATIIYDVKCSSTLRTEIEEAGGNALMWKTGHSFIKAKMKETNALLAGEMSGHIFFKERWYGFDDALYSAARLLEILTAQLRQPRVIFSSLMDSVNTPELNIIMQEGEQFKFIEQMTQKTSSFDDAEVNLVDGIRVDYNDGWGLVRASNTTPCLVLRFEGKNKAAMTRVQKKFREVLTSIQSDIKLPF